MYNTFKDLTQKTTSPSAAPMFVTFLNLVMKKENGRIRTEAFQIRIRIRNTSVVYNTVYTLKVIS